MPKYLNYFKNVMYSLHASETDFNLCSEDCMCCHLASRIEMRVRPRVELHTELFLTSSDTTNNVDNLNPNPNQKINSGELTDKYLVMLVSLYV